MKGGRKLAGNKPQAGKKTKAARETVASNDIELLYREDILDHYRHPHHYGRLPKARFRYRENNATCGDELEFFLELDARKRVKKAAFQGQGCAISMAAASMLADELHGLSVKKAKSMSESDIQRLLGVKIGASRIKCALLGLNAVKKALNKNDEQ